MSFLSLKKRFKKKIKQKIEIFVEELFKKRFDKKINIKNTIPKSTKITNSSLGGNIAIGERVLISNCEIFGNITIGNNTSLNGPNTDIHCMVNAVKIGNFCSIARNVSIQEYNHYFSHTTSYFIKHHIFEEDWTKEINSKGNIEIGNDVWIGTQCVILSGAKIGNGAVIAANSVVTKEIPPFAIAAGNPAKVIKYRFSDAIIQKLIEIKWWDWSLEKIKQNYTFFNGELSLEKFNHIK